MRHVSAPALLLTVLGAITLAACGGGDDDSGDGGSSSVTPTAIAGKGTPTAAELEAISRTQVPGFTAADARVVPAGASVTYTANAKNAVGSQVVVAVRVSGCDPFICASLDPKEYQSAEIQRNLKSILPTAHIESSTLRWDFGQVELGEGAGGLYTYALNYMEVKDSSGGTSRLSVNSYRAWYHNGSRFIELQAYSRGGPTAQSVPDLLGRMTKAEAEKAVQEVCAAFAPVFR